MDFYVIVGKRLCNTNSSHLFFYLRELQRQTECLRQVISRLQGEKRALEKRVEELESSGREREGRIADLVEEVSKTKENMEALEKKLKDSEEANRTRQRLEVLELERPSPGGEKRTRLLRLEEEKATLSADLEMERGHRKNLEELTETLRGELEEERRKMLSAVATLNS